MPDILGFTGASAASVDCHLLVGDVKLFLRRCWLAELEEERRRHFEERLLFWMRDTSWQHRYAAEGTETDILEGMESSTVGKKHSAKMYAG